MRELHLLEALLNNWPTKLMATVIAVMLWFYVLGAENPQATRTLTLPVAGENAPGGLAVISVTPKQAEVRVRGRTMRFEQTDFERMRLRADLSGAEVGEQTVGLTVSGLPLGLQVLPGHPTTARVRLDKIISRTRPVQILKLGEPSGDFVADSVEVEPSEVTVVGATSIVARVARVVVAVDLSGLNSNRESEAEPEARDLRDVLVSGLTFEPSQIKARVKVRRLNTKSVPVRPIMGSPAGGHQISWVRVRPPVVTLTGDGDTLAEINSVSTGRLDISGLTSRKTYTVALNLPQGVSALGAASVSVTVSVRGGGTPGGGSPDDVPADVGDVEGAGDEGTEGDGGEATPGADVDGGDDEEPPVPDPGDTPDPGTDDGDTDTTAPVSPDTGDSN